MRLVTLDPVAHDALLGFGQGHVAGADFAVQEVFELVFDVEAR